VGKGEISLKAAGRPDIGNGSRSGTTQSNTLRRYPMKDMFATFLLASMWVCTFVAPSPAQTITLPASFETAAPQTPAPGKNPVSTALRDILPDRKKNTVAAVKAMPVDKFNYKASADQRTFGELVVHMAETNNLLCGKVAAVPPPKVDEVKETDSKISSSPRSRPPSISAPTRCQK
jgi:hypothetical protein